MSQLHCYVADELAEKFKKKAESAHLPVSKYLALLIAREVESQWPDNYFNCFGAWQGEALERPEQGDVEKRADFD
jgi:hypothetical protein